MDRLRPLVDMHKNVFQHLVHKHKNTGKYVIARMRGLKEPQHHVMTYIAGKNEFIDEKMSKLKENELLFLIRFKDLGIYLILTEDVLC